MVGKLDITIVFLWKHYWKMIIFKKQNKSSILNKIFLKAMKHVLYEIKEATCNETHKEFSAKHVLGRFLIGVRNHDNKATPL